MVQFFYVSFLLLCVRTRDLVMGRSHVRSVLPNVCKFRKQKKTRGGGLARTALSCHTRTEWHFSGENELYLIHIFLQATIIDYIMT
jgi:hypothetical protein